MRAAAAGARTAAAPVLAGVAALVSSGLAACGGGRDAAGAPNVLLVTLDTTRADALTPYGGPPGLTPALARFAREGIVFEAAHTVAPLTLPAHASMLTGLYPIRHGVRDNALLPLPESAETLAELARGRGYQTGAFVAAVVLDAAFGLDQGFDLYDGPPRDREQASSHAAERPATEVVAAARRWLERRDTERPFFLWVHLFDPHAPYVPPAPFDDGRYGHPYLGEVAATDAAVGTLLDALREDGVLDETVAVVVADHGESLGAHGEETHGAFCYQETVWVPLIVRLPNAERAGTRVRTVASVVDLFPTLANAMGAHPAGDVDGRDLFAARPDPGAYFECYAGYLAFRWSPLAGWVDGRAKYLHSSQPELYDIWRDGREERNLVIERAELLPDYRRAIGDVAARPALASDADAIDPELLDDVRGLGYTAVGSSGGELPHPLAPTDLPSPASRVQEQRDFLAAMDLTNDGEHAAARAALETILAGNPNHYFAMDLLGVNLQKLGATEEAVAVLERVVREGPGWPSSWYNLGVCLAELGRRDEARAALERAVELDPGADSYRQELTKLR